MQKKGTLLDTNDIPRLIKPTCSRRLPLVHPFSCHRACIRSECQINFEQSSAEKSRRSLGRRGWRRQTPELSLSLSLPLSLALSRSLALPSLSLSLSLSHTLRKRDGNNFLGRARALTSSRLAGDAPWREALHVYACTRAGECIPEIHEWESEQRWVCVYNERDGWCRFMYRAEWW